MGEKLDFKTGFRMEGTCSLCNEETEVVPLDKGHGLLHFCKRHYWDSMKAPNGQAKPKKGKKKRPELVEMVGAPKPE